ncbi:ABC transporter ATP-binding protein [Thalassospira profundimaris]|uniref:ABC transporter ATP-binding protein n=1 Tax=Thalassospira profundimaris TaxID=502049 RepID=UPI0002872D4E|nr:ABC transporter ATP-binding protein [Thalassospira profundimaris]EKF07858.1 ABC transporter, ATP-binding component [Thalassospira profundimaris WP0211]
MRSTEHAPQMAQDNPTRFDIALRAARVAFNGVDIFHDLDLTLQAGSFTCLLGPSGVGKSTLLRYFAGLVEGDVSGTITCSDNIALTGRVAYMAQQDLLLPWRSVLENVVLGAVLRHEKPDYEKASHLLTEVGLRDAANLRPAELSGGMKQRAALARTLMEDRPVVLMDEPFSALDPLNRLRLQELAAQVLRGKTVLLVTHDPLEALRLGDRVHVLTGSPTQLQDAITPKGQSPRNIADPEILAQQAELLGQLGAERSEGAA